MCQISWWSVKPLRIIWQFFRFSSLRLSAILDFQKFDILRPVGFRGPICVNVPNFAEFGQNIAKIYRIIYFSIWRPSAILELLCACLDHPRRVFGGIYYCAKYDWYGCCTLDNKVQIMQSTSAVCTHDDKIKKIRKYDRQSRKKPSCRKGPDQL